MSLDDQVDKAGRHGQDAQAKQEAQAIQSQMGSIVSSVEVLREGEKPATCPESQAREQCVTGYITIKACGVIYLGPYSRSIHK